MTLHTQKDCLQRVHEAAECRSQIELASFLGIGQSSISDAKRRGTVPSEWLIMLFLKKSINPEWVLTGNGPRYAIPLETSPSAEAPISETPPPAEVSIPETPPAKAPIPETPPANAPISDTPPPAKALLSEYSLEELLREVLRRIF